ncbi:LacI family DNA-binding transcriptional regulator [Cellulomonas fengjieae]|uniref:LacI family DNA-binding transcriptional regulator n=1 Tax=Cellulomonas fengjieae TaxID=2819978 RepID=A0ABS3SBL9_9CELL|nr:LacI family DNA-binding transcriptional regulator [Cellulomonas fengjieae]MBO3083142.1 LacI family DNA-binding transcriptional regulator [Cellulomonas fengjieae]QVI65494.1 LacI family DNA-binding transcriptional regulator [Cellulomonas fengjieae]
MVRMVDVARQAGVSPMTVSNVVNGRPGVSPGTRARVLAAVAELGYEVNATARSLRTGRTGAVGLVLPDLEGPYHAHLFNRLAAGAESHGWHLLLQRTGGSREGELAAISPAHLRRFEGAIVNLVRLRPADLTRLRLEIPVVFIGESPVPRRFDHVMMDNVGGSRAATSRLLGTGSRRVAIVGGGHEDTDDMASLRTRGYREAHDDVGLAVDPGLVIEVPSYSSDQGHRAVLALHERDPSFDAVFCVTDALAMGALRALADLGLRVPGDVQVIGFDNGPEAEFTVPRLSSVEPGNEAITDQILAVLQQRIRADGAGGSRPPATNTAGARLVLRESTR